ncbi:MAG: hypothetical protein JNL12_11205 [Planctomycetes bacterium]|nr:hypothetical protein [Planctomycetota bacterium]
MDIRNVGSNGSVDRTGDRSKRTESKRDDASPSVPADRASISSAGRETAAAVEGLAERARADREDRGALVTAAMTKLMNGDLDGAAAIASAAQRLLDGGFKTV